MSEKSVTVTKTCPIPHCVATVEGPLRVCRDHYRLIPKPQAEALAHYARTRKGGPAHVASFERAVETITKVVEGRRPTRVVSAPYRDD